MDRSTDLITTPSLKCSWPCQMIEEATEAILVQWFKDNAYWEDAIYFSHGPNTEI